MVNKNVEEKETTLTEADFNAPVDEIDLRKIGIDVKPDPTMGNKSEGDIAIENIKSFVDSNNRVARNAIRQVYR